MKMTHKISVIILAISAFTSCTVKKTNSTPASASVANPSTTTTTTTTTTTSTTNTSVGGVSCDGIARDGATLCYYKNIPTIFASGGTYGQTWWSSTSFISTSGNSPGQFSTDATFNVRIIPRSPTAGVTSTFGKKCSPFMMNATKIQVQLMLHKNGVSIGEVATLSSAIGTPSNVWHFTVPATSDPLVLEVINVTSDSRCTGLYGTKLSSCSSNPYYDIPRPIPETDNPRECVAFDIQYSTDSTYDLPGSPAN